MNNAWQMGLGILQWSQDNHEKMPPADGYHDEVYPYIKDESVFTSDVYPFNYELDGQSDADIQNPAATEMGDILLPCARGVLFADGHVKVFPVVPAGTP
jgi:hypothetical protein